MTSSDADRSTSRRVLYAELRYETRVLEHFCFRPLPKPVLIGPPDAEREEQVLPIANRGMRKKTRLISTGHGDFLSLHAVPGMTGRVIKRDKESLDVTHFRSTSSHLIPGSRHEHPIPLLNARAAELRFGPYALDLKFVTQEHSFLRTGDSSVSGKRLYIRFRLEHSKSWVHKQLQNGEGFKIGPGAEVFRTSCLDGPFSLVRWDPNGRAFLRYPGKREWMGKVRRSTGAPGLTLGMASSSNPPAEEKEILFPPGSAGYMHLPNGQMILFNWK